MNKTIYLGIFLYVLYLCLGTGYISDDLSTIRYSGEVFSGNNFNMQGNYINMPLSYLLMQFPTELISYEYSYLCDLLKAAYLFLALLCFKEFLKLYFEKKVAVFIAFLFLLFPSHDATIFWLIGQHLILSFCVYSYAYVLLKTNKYKASFVVALVASFLSYSSPAAAGAFFLLASYKFSWKKGLILLVPNMIYTVYYLSSNLLYSNYESRLNTKLSAWSLLKNLFIQFGTCLDANLGLSLWLKLYASLIAISFTGICMSLALIIIMYKQGFGNEAFWKRIKVQKEFALFTLLVVFLWLSMFALTGRYPQIAFNLGNRTLAIPCLISILVLLWLPLHYRVKNTVVVFLVFAICGLSNHWKDWQEHQGEVIHTMSSNGDLKNLPKGTDVYVVGNHYSHLGSFAHLEFLSEDWVNNGVYRYKKGGEVLRFLPLSSRFKQDGDTLIDVKYNKSYGFVNGIQVYDSNTDELKFIKKEKITQYVSSLDKAERHWIQKLENDMLNGLLIKLMPRLEYAF